MASLNSRAARSCSATSSTFSVNKRLACCSSEAKSASVVGPVLCVLGRSCREGTIAFASMARF
eukprot:scaffold6585_cov403-Prasinococcus_capsulatus_cf.AAC.10